MRYFKGQVTTIANSEDDPKSVGRKLKNLVEQCEKPGDFAGQREGG